jgi:L-serine dehydratase
VTISVFELFKLGVGPSSSHTMGPMTAAARFIDRLRQAGDIARVQRVSVKLCASLALTGRGHATDRAVMLGLMGFQPASFNPDAADAAMDGLIATGQLRLCGPVQSDSIRSGISSGPAANACRSIPTP